jgi:hypothetical protein
MIPDAYTRYNYQTNLEIVSPSNRYLLKHIDEEIRLSSTDYAYVFVKLKWKELEPPLKQEPTNTDPWDPEPPYTNNGTPCIYNEEAISQIIEYYTKLNYEIYLVDNHSSPSFLYINWDPD